jgi:hypothetical protein
VSVERDVSMEAIDALAESLEEMTRALKIRAGVDPDAPPPTIDEIRAETIALRARNDQAHAEMVGRWRTYD